MNIHTCIASIHTGRKTLRSVKATCTSVSGSCLFGPGLAAPSLRSVRALWRVRPRTVACRERL